MAATTSETNASRYPSEKSVKEALDMLKPPGILSKAYNQFQLKRYQREEAIRKNHIVTSAGGDAVANSWKVERPKSLDLTQDTSYFRAKTLHEKPSTYDRINHVVEGYNQKLHRDDREHARSRGLKVNSEIFYRKQSLGAPDHRLADPSIKKNEASFKTWSAIQKETKVAVPSLSSSVIGHPCRNPLEFSDRQHVRVEICKKDFLRLGGTNIGDTD